MDNNLPPIILDLMIRLANPATHRQERVNIYNTLSKINAEVGVILDGYERETGTTRNQKDKRKEKPRP